MAELAVGLSALPILAIGILLVVKSNQDPEDNKCKTIGTKCVQAAPGESVCKSKTTANIIGIMIIVLSIVPDDRRIVKRLYRAKSGLLLFRTAFCGFQQAVYGRQGGSMSFFALDRFDFHGSTSRTSIRSYS